MENFEQPSEFLSSFQGIDLKNIDGLASNQIFNTNAELGSAFNNLDMNAPGATNTDGGFMSLFSGLFNKGKELFGMGADAGGDKNSAGTGGIWGALKALASLGQGYASIKQVGLAEDAFKFNKRDTINKANNAAVAYNSHAEAKQRALHAANKKHSAVDDEWRAKNTVKGLA